MKYQSREQIQREEIKRRKEAKKKKDEERSLAEAREQKKKDETEELFKKLKPEYKAELSDREYLEFVKEYLVYALSIKRRIEIDNNAKIETYDSLVTYLLSLYRDSMREDFGSNQFGLNNLEYYVKSDDLYLGLKKDEIYYFLGEYEWFNSSGSTFEVKQISLDRLIRLLFKSKEVDYHSQHWSLSDVKCAKKEHVNRIEEFYRITTH